MRASHALLLCLCALAAFAVRAESDLYEWAALDEVVVDDEASHSRELLARQYGIAAVPGSYPSPSPGASPGVSPVPGQVVAVQVVADVTSAENMCDETNKQIYAAAMNSALGAADGNTRTRGCAAKGRRRLHQSKTYTMTTTTAFNTQDAADKAVATASNPSFGSSVGAALAARGLTATVANPTSVGKVVVPVPTTQKPAAVVPVGVLKVTKNSGILVFKASPLATSYSITCNLKKRDGSKTKITTFKQGAVSGTTGTFQVSLTKLKAGTRYGCAVLAVNSAGKSRARGGAFTTKRS